MDAGLGGASGGVEELPAVSQGRDAARPPLRPPAPAEHQEYPEPVLKAVPLDQAVAEPRSRDRVSASPRRRS